jgi:hypothetical protein
MILYFLYEQSKACFCGLFCLYFLFKNDVKHAEHEQIIAKD